MNPIIGELSTLTDRGSYFEDFAPGQRFRHARGATFGEVENNLFTKLTMNTAQGHFNEDRYGEDHFLGAGRIVNGFLVASMVFGLASQDASENLVREVSCTDIRMRSPTHHGDTIYAYTEVVSVGDQDMDGAGLVEFRHWGVNQRSTIVFEGRRTCLIKRRGRWCP